MTSYGRVQGHASRRRPRVFIPYLHPSSFIVQDIETLSETCDVRALLMRSIRALPTGLRDVARADIVYCWFGSVRYLPYIAVARLLGKPVVVVTGGYDVADEPSIDYGNMRPGIQRILGRLVFRLATLSIAFSETSLRELRQNARVPADRSRLILLGFDVAQPAEPIRPDAKQPIVLAIGIIDATTIHRKGWLTVARMSKLVPDVSVVFVGKAAPAALAELRAVAGPNVRFAGFVASAERDALCASAAVYAQPSVHEGFGCAVAEAMLFDCVPIVSNRGSLPEVVGSCGYYVPPDDAEALASAVRQALARGAPGSESPRTRITRLFPLSLRRARLNALIDELLANKTMRTT
jgi:glycosyltransferase involved in cell wall biosynthesis